MGNRFVRKRHPPEVLERWDSCGGGRRCAGELKRGVGWTRLLGLGEGRFGHLKAAATGELWRIIIC
jgi:hypothetical protein